MTLDFWDGLCLGVVLMFPFVALWRHRALRAEVGKATAASNPSPPARHLAQGMIPVSALAPAVGTHAP
jgi:hypothetical protein